MKTETVHRAMFDAVQHRNWDRLAELFHPDYTYIGTDGAEHGAKTSLAVAQTYTSAFPDLRFEILHQHVIGDRSIIELRATGTNTGPLEGRPPTNQSMSLTACNVVEVSGDRILREREYFDTGALMAQLDAGIEPADHRQTVGDIYQAFGRGDVDSILERLADDVAWDVDTPHWGLPWYQPRRGRDGVREFFDVIAKELEFQAFEPVAMLTNDNQVAAVIRFEFTVRATGRRVEDSEIHLWTFGDDGRVTKFVHVVDHHAQLLAFRNLQDT